MNRHTWNFPYGADKLLIAAMDKKTYHEGRMKWWADKRDETKTKLQASGIEISESVAASANNSFSTSNYRGHTVSLNHEMVNNMNECVEKVRTHENLIKEYSAWVEVLASQGQSSFNLNQDDWLYFFGKR